MPQLKLKLKISKNLFKRDDINTFVVFELEYLDIHTINTNPHTEISIIKWDYLWLQIILFFVLFFFLWRLALTAPL